MVNDVLDWLTASYAVKRGAGLERMHQALALLGNPHQQYPCIHITGTNGKGSTVAFMRQLALAHHVKVGTFTSPHMVSYHDRICVDAEPILEATFIAIAHRVRACEREIAMTHGQLTYFEIMTLCAFVYFAEHKVDVALIEVGIGGRNDCTNVIDARVNVVTTIGLDHVPLLGYTIADVAYQKAGIIKPHADVITGALLAEASAIVKQTARSAEGKLYQLGEHFTVSITARHQSGHVTFQFHSPVLSLQATCGLVGVHQADNAAVALHAFVKWMQQANRPIDVNACVSAIEATRWPGRMELCASAPVVFIDGAHNAEGMAMLMRNMTELFPKMRVNILFAALSKKDIPAVAGVLREHPDKALFLTSFADEGAAAVDTLHVLLPHGKPIDDWRDFLAATMTQNHQDDEMLIVTGSLYFIAQVRAWFNDFTDGVSGTSSH